MEISHEEESWTETAIVSKPDGDSRALHEADQWNIYTTLSHELFEKKACIYMYINVLLMK